MKIVPLLLAILLISTKVHAQDHQPSNPRRVSPAKQQIAVPADISTKFAQARKQFDDRLGVWKLSLIHI